MKLHGFCRIFHARRSMPANLRYLRFKICWGSTPIDRSPRKTRTHGKIESAFIQHAVRPLFYTNPSCTPDQVQWIPLLRNSCKKFSGSTFRKICSKKCLSITKYSTKLIFSASQNSKTSEKAKQRLFQRYMGEI